MIRYCNGKSRGIEFDGTELALAVPKSDLRLIGKPEFFTHRRMDVALAYANDIETARENAKKALLWSIW